MDADEFDASELLRRRVIEEDILRGNNTSRSKLCSKIIYFDSHYYKAYCEGNVAESPDMED